MSPSNLIQDNPTILMLLRDRAKGAKRKVWIHNVHPCTLSFGLMQIGYPADLSGTILSGTDLHLLKGRWAGKPNVTRQNAKRIPAGMTKFKRG